MGGAKIISELINARLIDDFRITIQPILLGSGISLFCDITGESYLKLLDVNKYDSGITELRYLLE